jgi:hypothetical protein
LKRKLIWLLAILFTLATREPFSAVAADDTNAAARATLERIQALRKERPDDGVLVYYEALVRIGLGEREAAFDLLRSLKDRKLGLIPARGVGFDEVWNDTEFAAVRKELAEEETRNARLAGGVPAEGRELIPEGIAYDAKDKRFFLRQHCAAKDHRDGWERGGAQFFRPRR